MIQQSKCLDIFDTNLKAKHNEVDISERKFGDIFNTNLKAKHNTDV